MSPPKKLIQKYAHWKFVGPNKEERRRKKKSYKTVFTKMRRKVINSLKIILGQDDKLKMHIKLFLRIMILLEFCKICWNYFEFSEIFRLQKYSIDKLISVSAMLINSITNEQTCKTRFGSDWILNRSSWPSCYRFHERQIQFEIG